QRTYLPERNRRRYEQAQARRSDFVLHESAYFEPYTVRRLHPEAVTGKAKYLHPKGAPVPPMPAPNAIKAHREAITGGTVYFIEGYFKAIALDTAGAEVTAFSGIGLYPIKEEVRAYLERRKPDRVVILYDADAKNLSTPKDGAPWSDKRPRGFLASVTNFARRFFALREGINPQARLYFAMVNPASKYKGFDDLLQHGNPAQRAEILEELDTLPKRGRYVHALRLHRTAYLARMRRFFALDTYRTFYETHRAQIGGQAFQYEKRAYKAHTIGKLTRFTLTDDPYQADQGGQRLFVRRWLEEARRELDTALKEEGRLAIEAPTGSGKTTFFAKLPRRTGQRVVVACPTVNLARQAAGKVRGAVAIHGRASTRRSNKAAEAQLVFCTYDTLHQLPDIHRRIVVIDEAHNLVNQFGEVANTYNPFRAEKLRTALELAGTGKKAVFLSGTMPPLLAQAVGAKLIQVNRKDSNKVRVHALEADGANTDKLTAATLAELHRIDYTEDRLHFVFMNNTEQMEAIRAHLIEAGHLEAGQIELITRRTVNQGKRRGYDHIVEKESLPGGVKLVLSTCLISEGVNIVNRNIGRVLYAGPRCADTFRQYVARFRNVPTLEVTAILPKENNLRERFLHCDVSKMLDRCQRTAALQVQFAEEELEETRSQMAPEELEHLAQIEAEKGTYNSILFSLIYFDQDNTPRPDVLRILATVREEKLRGTNNAYFLQEITAAPNIALYSHAGAEVDKDTTQAVKDA
ncbi:MAG: DEAD/DEAH box helicase, partial [Planctomycetes bacterium]|nr:DEAD/DEAH box helicase [Planctomycetota bacterium]